MTKEDYEKLNYYLNGCFKNLEVCDTFLLQNIISLARLSDDYIHLTNGYKLELSIKPGKLTFQEVYLLAREIIESIDKSYLKYYDELIDSGILDFGFEREYINSHFMYNLKTGERLININRKFNYIDVTTLVHEFIHYMNGLSDKLSENRHLLTEAISIYYEEYAKKYLLDKGISKEELYLNERIVYTRQNASRFNWYSLILFTFQNFGNIDEKTYELLNVHVCKITKEEFEEECKKALLLCEKENEKYEFEYKMTSNENSIETYEEKLFERLTKFLNIDYRYVFGTVIAYYALEYSTMEKMTYLCNHINEYPYATMGVIELLKEADIDINDLDIKIIENVLNNTERKSI